MSEISPQAVISCIASIKQRPIPDSISHPSVGTEGDIAKRAEEKKQRDSLKLSVGHLEPYILSLEEMRQWGYVVEVPPGTGGDRPSEEGSVKTCERCNQPFKVKRKDEADECVFHWGRPYSSKANGSSPFLRITDVWLTGRYICRRIKASVQLLLPNDRRRAMFARATRLLRIQTRRSTQEARIFPNAKRIRRRGRK